MSSIYNPATGETIAEIKREESGELEAAVRRAREAQPQWAAAPFREKQALFKKLVREIGHREKRLTEAITRCTGKTRIDALGTEVLPAAIAARYYPGAARRFMRPRKQKRSSVLFFNKSSSLHREPYGVVGIISPWNYPFGIPFHEVTQALAVGNAVAFVAADGK